MQPKALTYADRSERGKLRFTGRQSRWFLHQILTQSFEDAQPGDARPAALLTPHGRMIGYLEALVTNDAVLCHFEPQLRATLPDAIRRYVLATEVEVTDVADEMGLVLLAGAGYEVTAQHVRPDLLVHPTDSLGIPAGYLWCDRSELHGVIQQISSAARRAAEEELEELRIANGIPRWGRDMDEKTFPQEVGIDRTAVNYAKGCYVGQEAMAKIHFRGKVNRRLARLASSGSISPGAQVLLGDQKVGTVTSSAYGSALAMLRHTVPAGEAVTIDGAAARVVA